MLRRNLTDVKGVLVGHSQDLEALTGCTVVLCEAGAVAGVEVRGSAPGTRETDLLQPVNLVDRVHGVVLAGGSAYGLDAASGVMEYLEARGVGLDVGVCRVPIVPAAVIFDLEFGRADRRPDRAMGLAACRVASSGALPEGGIGAGCGATIGKVLGMGQAMAGGLGNWAEAFADGLVVAALVVVNAFGDVVDPDTGQVLTGTRNRKGQLAGSLQLLTAGVASGQVARNTTLGVVATNACLDKEGAVKVARMAQDGLARAIVPAHTMYDGDTVFALAVGEVPAEVTRVGSIAAAVVARAVVRAALAAEGRGGLPGRRDLAATRPAAPISQQEGDPAAPGL